MLRVGYKITIGSTTLQSSRSNRLLALETSAAIDVPVNRCRIVLDGHAQLSAAAGDPVKVQLGYGNNLPLVFTGRLDTIEHSFGQICVEARGAFAELVAARQNGVYEQQHAGAIVGDLLSARQIAKGTLETGERLARFTVSNHQTVWAVLHDLGQRCGCDFYADCEDRAVFKHYAPRKTYRFTYGGDILEYRPISPGPARDGAEGYAERPADPGQREDASSWLAREAAQGATVQSDRARGRLRARGAPAVQLGDAVQIAQLPDSAQNDTFKVTGVRHRLSRSTGFISDIIWEQVEE